MIRAERQTQIINWLERHGVASIANLAKEFQASEITIRRDLAELGREGLLDRTHGGARRIDANSLGREPSPYAIREHEQAREKTALGKAAARFVADGESLIVNAGTTMRQFALQLRARDLKVVTNGITVAPVLAELPGSDVLLLGGAVDPRKMATIGIETEQMLQNIRVRKAILGVSGISAEHGIFMHSAEEARVNAALIAHADEVIVVADATKFAANQPYRIAPWSAATLLITEERVPADLRAAIAARGVEIITC